MIHLDRATQRYVTDIQRRWSVRIDDDAPTHLPQHDPNGRTAWREGGECDQLSLLIHDLEYISCQLRFFKNGYYHFSTGLDSMTLVVDVPNATIDVKPLYAYEEYTRERRGTFYRLWRAAWSIGLSALSELPAPKRRKSRSSQPWTIVIDDVDEDGEGRDRYAITPKPVPFDPDRHITAYSVSHRQTGVSLCTVLQNQFGAFVLVTEGSVYAIADPKAYVLTIVPWCGYARDRAGRINVIPDPALDLFMPYVYEVQPDDLHCARVLTAIRRDLKKRRLSVSDDEIAAALHLPHPFLLNAEPRAYFLLKALDHVPNAELHRLLGEATPGTAQDQVVLSVLRLMPTLTRDHLRQHVEATYDQAQRTEQASHLAERYPAWAAEIVRLWHEMASLPHPLMADAVLDSVTIALDTLHLPHGARWSLVFELHEASNAILTACLPPEVQVELHGEPISTLMGLYYVCQPLTRLHGNAQVAEAIRALWTILAQGAPAKH